MISTAKKFKVRVIFFRNTNFRSCYIYLLREKDRKTDPSDKFQIREKKTCFRNIYRHLRHLFAVEFPDCIIYRRGNKQSGRKKVHSLFLIFLNNHQLFLPVRTLNVSHTSMLIVAKKRCFIQARIGF